MVANLEGDRKGAHGLRGSHGFKKDRTKKEKRFGISHEMNTKKRNPAHQKCFRCVFVCFRGSCAFVAKNIKHPFLIRHP